MSFESSELSQFGGNKVFLYVWTRGAATYRYAAADQDLIIDFQRFEASGVIRHGPIEQGGDPIRSPIEVTVASDNPVVALYRIVPPVDRVFLTIYEAHAADLSSRRPVWQGRVTSVKWEPITSEAVITHEPTYTSLQRMGLRRAYQTLCPLVTGGKRCGINMEAFAIDAVVQEVNGQDISLVSVLGKPDGYFLGGYLVYEVSSGVPDRRQIREHTGLNLKLQGFPIGMVAGTAVRVYPGDDHTPDTCANRFNNINNYGGFLYFPSKNPFGGSPIY